MYLTHFDLLIAYCNRRVYTLSEDNHDLNGYGSCVFDISLFVLLCMHVSDEALKNELE